MNRYIIQLLIIVFVFLIILWIQRFDDTKQNKKRDTLYDKIKVPLLVSAITGLLLNINIDNLFSFKKNNKINEILIVTPKTGPNIMNQDVYIDLDF